MYPTDEGIGAMKQRRTDSRCRGGRDAASLVEISIILGITVLILFFVQSLLSGGIRQTVKGTALLATIKEANDLFSALRSDLLSAGQVYTVDDTDRPVQVHLSSEGEGLPSPDTYSYPSAIIFSQPGNATVTYLLHPMTGGKNAVVRVLRTPGGLERKLFAVPKIHVFRTLVLLQEHRLNGCPVFTRHVFVEIELKETDPRGSQKPVRIAMFLSPSNITLSTWNYLF